MNYELCNDTPMFEVGTFIQTEFRSVVTQGKCIGWRRGTACIEVKFDVWDPLETSPRMLVVPQQMVDFVPDWRDKRIAELEARVKALAVERDEAVMSTQKDIRAHLRTVIKAECSAGLDRKNDIWDSGYYSGMHKMLAEVTHWMRSKMAKEVTP